MAAIIFYILAVTVIVFSFLTISSKNILRVAVYLLFVLGSTSGIYFMMNFNFLAAVQLTVYAGGIVVLIIFSILLTHQINTRLEHPALRKRLMSAGICLIAGSVFLWGLTKYHFKVHTVPIRESGISLIGSQLMNTGDNGYVLPFEVISILLLGAMIAAIIIAKKFSND